MGINNENSINVNALKDDNESLQKQKQISECEIAYSKCFSDTNENDSIIRFRDSQLQDMYYHNFTYLKMQADISNFPQFINQEIEQRLSENADFCLLKFNFTLDNTILSTLKYNAEISRNGFYSFDISQINKLNSVLDCVVERVHNTKMIDDILYCDLQLDEATLGKDFCTRRCYRRSKVYLADSGVDSFVCYYRGNIVGNCDMFIHNGVAKIEDFTVISTHQRKGYGTTILKALIDIALNKNCHTIYLVTDEDDTAKDMYRKLGFNKILERTDLFFKL